MSWSNWCENFLLKHSKLDENGAVSEWWDNACVHAAIVGKDGTTWAASSGFSLRKGETITVDTDDGGSEKVVINEFDNLKDCLDNKGRVTKKGGVYLNGEKYVATSSVEYDKRDPSNPDPNILIVYLKKNKGGAAIGKTIEGNFIIGVWSSEAEIYHKSDKSTAVPATNYHCNAAVEMVCDYLNKHYLASQGLSYGD